MKNCPIKQVVSNLVTSDLVCPKLSETIDERSLLAIIEYIKAAELASGRFDNVDEVIRHYTHWACLDIAQALHAIYNTSDNQKVVDFSTAIATSGFARLPTTHYVLAFGGQFYDILGKHTQDELENYCKREFCWQGAKHKILTEADLAKYATPDSENFDNPVVTYCISQIKKHNPSLATNCDFNNN